MNAHQHYALLRRTPRALALRRIIQEVVKPGQMVLDAGCGSGLLSVWAAQAGAIVVGVDFADLALARALATENGVADRTTFLQGDLNAIGLEEHGPFDVLLAMVYLKDPRRDHGASAMVHDLGRHLRPGAVRVPDQVRYTAQALDCRSQHFASRMADLDRGVKELEVAFGMRMDSFRSAMGHRPPKEAFPVRDDAGVVLLPDARALSEVRPWHTVDYSLPATPWPDHLALTMNAPGSFTTVLWQQELMFRDALIFRNGSVGWVHPAPEVAAGDTVRSRTGTEWHIDNLLLPA